MKMYLKKIFFFVWVTVYALPSGAMQQVDYKNNKKTSIQKIEAFFKKAINREMAVLALGSLLGATSYHVLQSIGFFGQRVPDLVCDESLLVEMAEDESKIKLLMQENDKLKQQLKQVKQEEKELQNQNSNLSYQINYGNTEMNKKLVS